MSPKYTIIIPVYNGMPYLKACIESVLNSEFANFELIVSNDHSIDGGDGYLSNIKDPRIKYIKPINRLSMTEHWEWALSKSSGEWIMFLGQDDGVQSYFFELAELLTEQAKNLNLKIINSRRAYYFWPGCEFKYGDIRVSYSAQNKMSVKSCFYSSIKALAGMSYHELPQMYTNSMFHRDLIERAKFLQGGEVFRCHPQDANLAALATSLESHYLRCEVPLGWVGSSPKSAGLAISSAEDSQVRVGVEIKNLRNEYIKKINSSNLKYHRLAGVFSLNLGSIYYWQALLSTRSLRSGYLNNLIRSKIFLLFLFASAWIKETGAAKNSKREEFINLLRLNTISIVMFRFSYLALCLLASLRWILVLLLIRVPNRLMKYIRGDEVIYVVPISDSDLTMRSATLNVDRKIRLSFKELFIK